MCLRWKENHRGCTGDERQSDSPTDSNCNRLYCYCQPFIANRNNIIEDIHLDDDRAQQYSRLQNNCLVYLRHDERKRFSKTFAPEPNKGSPIIFIMCILDQSELRAETRCRDALSSISVPNVLLVGGSSLPGSRKSSQNRFLCSHKTGMCILLWPPIVESLCSIYSKQDAYL